MPDIFDQYAHERPHETPTIYAYSDVRYPGCLKVGFTTRTVEQRMKEHYPVKVPHASYKVEYTASAVRDDGSSFMDHDVHHVLERKGIHAINKSEWYECTVDDVKAAVISVKNRIDNINNRTNTFGMRPEQRIAVQRTKEYFLREKKENPSHTPKYLWNCKMRFGKTFSSYQLAKSMGLSKILILTFKPAVEESWESDLLNHVDFEGWQFYSRKSENITPNDLDMTAPIVCFGSFQDFLGTNEAGGIKAKNEWVHALNWDLVIFDEYHFGAWRENAKHLFDDEDDDAFDSMDMESYKKNEADNAINESFLPITTSYYLFLSGTPFRSLNSGEFLEDQIFNWTYSDEQKAKNDWSISDGKNPYEALPQMILMTYKLPESIQRIAVSGEFNEFDLNVFFSAKEENKGEKKSAQFVYKEYVQKWLDLIRGAYLASSVDDLKLGKNNKPVMPFSDVRMLNNLTHTLWFLPNVNSCYAMANLLKEKQNVFYQDYNIVVAAGTEAGVGLAALGPVREAMRKPLESKSITLSCGKLTTGVTVKPWTGIFMLRNLSSPETYFQAAFRVQSPWTIKGDNYQDIIMKKECYVFDFAINRALRQVSDYSCRLNVKQNNPEEKVQEFVHFLPVIAYDGSTMKAVSAQDILDITTAGTSASLLARRWESALLVNVDNATLQRILDNPDALAALNNIEGFRALNKDIETIINKSNAVKKAKKEHEGSMSKKEKQQLSEEEKEYKSKRKKIQEKLIKFATRIPVFMYLTDYRESTLKDVITQFEPRLFQRVTGLSVKDFELLVSLGVFNDTLMNEAVYKFRRYEDSSLEYTGLSKHSSDENVGLFSTVITHADYEAMAEQQKISMNEQNSTLPKTNIKNKPSFITPSITTYTKNENHTEVITKEPSFDLSTLMVGDKVEHKKFGIGLVSKIEIDKDVLTIRFENGEKSFMSSAFDNGFLMVKSEG